MITAEELEVDDAVLMVNVPVVEPDATVTVEGTVALELLDERVTTVPPLGAGLVRVTVPVEEEPATTVVGERVSDDSLMTLSSSAATQPLMTGAPQPEAVSQPTAAVDVVPFGSVPFVPETMS